MKNIIEVKNIEKNYGSKKVLKNINFKIEKNESIAVIGANGAGKTTLVEIICQTKKSSKGTIKYNFAKGSIKENIGIQFQEGNWPTGLTPKDIIHFYRGVYQNVTNKQIDKLINIFEIEEFFNRGLNKLSGGQKQRFNALLAVIHSPSLIILDEITTGLDIQLQYKILKYIKELTESKKHTLILVSHNPEEVQNLVKRVLLLHEGEIYLDLKIDEVIKKFGNVRQMMNQYFEGKLIKSKGSK